MILTSVLNSINCMKTAHNLTQWYEFVMVYAHEKKYVNNLLLRLFVSCSKYLESKISIEILLLYISSQLRKVFILNDK